MITYYKLPPDFSDIRPVRVIAPYLPEFAKEARLMGGEWDKSRREWCFPEPEWKIQDLVKNFYGYCPPDQPELVSVVVDLQDKNRTGMVIGFGRIIASRSLWSQPVQLHETVRILSGHFSMQNSDGEKRLGKNNVRLLIRHVPLSMATNPPQKITIEKVVYDEPYTSNDEAYHKSAMMEIQQQMVQLQSLMDLYRSTQ